MLKLVLSVLHYCVNDQEYFGNNEITLFVKVHWDHIHGSKPCTPPSPSFPPFHPFSPLFDPLFFSAIPPLPTPFLSPFLHRLHSVHHLFNAFTPHLHPPFPFHLSLSSSSPRCFRTPILPEALFLFLFCSIIFFLSVFLFKNRH